MALSPTIGTPLSFSSSELRRRPLLLRRPPHPNFYPPFAHPNPVSNSRSGSYRIEPLESVRFDRLLTSDAEEEIGEGFFEAIEELERMVRDPSDVLGELVERLSARELQLVLVYFAQDGRDSYCALEVFDWLRKENRVDAETMELMVSIACGWIERLIGGEHEVGDVVALLNEMDCVGLDPAFSMVEKVVSLYWEKGKKDEAVAFVKDFLRRGGVGSSKIEDGGVGDRGPVGYLVWKMMVDGNYLEAVQLVIDFKENGLKPEVYSYVIALTALVKEQKEFSKALRKLKSSIKAGSIDKLDVENLSSIEKYQSVLISNGILLSNWALQEGSSMGSGVVHERLLSLYTCAGLGLEAEQQLWLMKLSGKEPDRELYDAVLATCASQKETGAVNRLLAGAEAMSAGFRKKTFSWLLRGYLKGGYNLDASETLIRMLELGLCPDYSDRVAVLQGLRKSIQESGNIEPYTRLCKLLSDKGLLGPCLLYLYISKYKLWILKML